MRKKEWKVIITFDTTTRALEMEEVCKTNHMFGRLIPVPREITSGCGLCYCINIEQKETMIYFIKQKKLSYQQIYDLEL